jgi:hypothetical protein
MDLPIEVPLKRPVVVGDQTYDKLLFDEPDLGTQIEYAELEASFSVPPSSVDAVRVHLFWISHLGGIPEAVAKKIKSTDIDAIDEVVEAILKPMFKKGADKIVGNDSGNDPPAK